MPPTANEIDAGQAIYTKATLRIYDFLVLGISNRWIWRCPTSRLLRMYNDDISANHLDVGVGTGYLLDHCRFPAERPRIGLLDLNATCLQTAAQRIARYQPMQFQANVLMPIEIDEAPFDSVGLNYVLHCLPGSMLDKAVVFQNLTRLIRPGGILFGSTLLGGGIQRGWASRGLMAYYNRQRIFCNRDDHLDQLGSALGEHFESHVLEVVGSAALFAGRIASQ
ncbi:MAG: class I SAM-dependent methyltransferase [Pirellulaceae bacterium]|nr:class I SAM-dependent methyltransferase [Pirellulaceae bacterium]